jgi:hypothetical protein
MQLIDSRITHTGNGRMQDLAQLPESTMTRNVRELIYDVQRNFEHKMHRILGNYVGVINPKVRCYIYETDSQQIVLKIGILVTNREDSWEAASNPEKLSAFQEFERYMRGRRMFLDDSFF